MHTYLIKHRFCARQLDSPVDIKTNIIIVIPSFNEQGLIKTLQSLFDCTRPKCVVEIIVVINSGESADENILLENEKTFSEASTWIEANQDIKLKYFLINIKNLPGKHAGVGLARKIGMDEAVLRYNDISNQEGVIVCLDADCIVDKNYLIEIEKYFETYPEATGCSIYFEHPLEGHDHSHNIYKGIINYELFLRYYKLALDYCGFPFAFHTIGSCMAVRSNIYQKQGGMNRRKAGEDFYFLHKIFPIGHFGELNLTRVIPSPRESSRVPFGTGSAIQKFLAAGKQTYMTYNFQCFSDLKIFFKLIPQLYKSSAKNVKKSLELVPASINEFLLKHDFEKNINEFNQHSASEKTFLKRFYNWFDGFMVLKFVHFARDNFYDTEEILDAALKLIHSHQKASEKNISKKEMLLLFRQWERSKIIISQTTH